MPQFCDKCGRMMDLITTVNSIKPTRNVKLYKCPVCGKERKTNGRGEEI